MNSHRALPSVLLSATMMAATPTDAAATAQIDAGHAGDAGCAVRARNVLAGFEQGDYAALRRDFDARLQEALPEPRLRATWSGLAAQLGTLDRRGEARTRVAGNRTLGIVPLHFAMGWFELQVSCTADGHLDSLWIRPALQSPDEEAADVPLPAYADPARYREQDLSIGTGATSLPAILTRPIDAQRVPAVVLVHGSGAHDADETVGPNKPFRDIALGLASRGVAVLRYVKRAFAHPDDYAEGRAYTVNDETVDDAVLALRLLRQQPGIDPARVFVLGHSLGAMMAPRIVEHDPAVAGAILLAAPAERLEDTFVRQTRYLGATSGSERLDALMAQRDEVKRLTATTAPTTSMMLHLPASYWLDLAGYDPIAVAKRLHQPMLVLQGGRDYQVTPADDFATWRKAFEGQPRVTLTLYPPLSHLFMPGSEPPSPRDYQQAAHVDAGVVADIADWIARRAPAGRP